MAASQPPGRPALPLVNAALGGEFAPATEDTFADVALGTGAPPAPPQGAPGAPVTTPASLEAPQPFSGRAAELMALMSPEAQAATAVAQQQFLAQEAADAQARAEQEQHDTIGGALAAGGKAFAEGLYTGVTAIPRGVASLGYAVTGSEALKDFVRETAPANVFPTISAVGAGGLSSELTSQHAATDAELAAHAVREAQRREWANLTAAAEMGGLVTGTIASGLGVGALVGGVARASSLAFGGGALRQAGIGAAEGLLQGAAQPFNDGGTATQREILTSALIGTLIGGGMAGAGTAIASRLPDAAAFRALAKPKQAIDDLHARVFGRPKVAPEVADDIARSLDPDAPVGAGADAVAAKEYFDALTDERRAAIAAAGPNPKAMREAAEEASARMQEKVDAEVKKLGRIDEDNWKGIAPQYRPILKEEIIEGASRDLERTHNSLLDNTRTLESFLKDAGQKAEKVRANIVESQIDDATAMRAAYGTLEDIRKSFSDALMQRAKEVPLKKGAGQAAKEVRPLQPDPEFWGPYNNRIKTIEYTLKKADEAFTNAKDAADAYIVLDQARREIAAHVSGLQRSAVSDNPLLADPARLLQKWSRDEYEGRLISHLSDPTLYGKQATAQSQVNLAWRDKIDASKLGNISTQIGEDFGAKIFAADPEKARALLTSIDKGQRSLRRDKLTAYYDAAEDMATAIRNNYDLTPKQAKAADEAIAKARAAKEILATVDRQSSALTERVVKSLMSNVTGGVGGVIAGGVAGGPVGSVIGAAVIPMVQEWTKNIVRRVAVATAKEGAEELAESGVQKVAKKLGADYVESLNAKVLGLGAAGAGLASELLESTRGKPQEERFRIYEERSKALGVLASNPERQTEAIGTAIGDLANTRPTMAGLLGIQMMGSVRELEKRWPGKKEISIIPSQRKTTASLQEIQKSEALWEATVAPNSVFIDYQDGNVDYDKVRFSQQLYPEMWNLYRAAIVDQLSALPADALPNESQLTQLDYFFGFNGALQPTVNPAFAARFDGYNQELQKQYQPPPQGAPLKTPAANETFTQRIASRA